MPSLVIDYHAILYRYPVILHRQKSRLGNFSNDNLKCY
jgi:hypothetical protein